MNTKPSVKIKTFGCRSNFSDTIDLASRIENEGGVPSDFDEKSYNDKNNLPTDYLIVNTCTVTDTADLEAIKFIEKSLKKIAPEKIIITGCMAEASREKLLGKFPGIKVVSPNDRKEIIENLFNKNSLVNLPTKLNKSTSAKPVLLKRPSYKFDIENLNLPANTPPPGGMIGEFKFRSRFHLRIQEGCENHCTFCIIPSTRGHLSSKQVDKVLLELTKLEDLGYKEVVLTGTHLGGYGEDLGENLLSLLIKIEKKFKNLRIRLSSLDPNDVSFEMIDFLSQSNTFCNHLHICFQAFNDKILKRMNRKYSLGEAEDLVWYIDQQYRKHKTCFFTLGSDTITGFPGESRKDLEEGIKKFVSLPLSYLHVFPYSERDGTAATRLDGSVSLEERSERSRLWRKASHEKFSLHTEKAIGSKLDVILESKIITLDGANEDEPNEKKFLLGTSSEYLDIAIPLTDTILPGQRFSVNAKTFLRDRQLLICEL